MTFPHAPPIVLAVLALAAAQEGQDARHQLIRREGHAQEVVHAAREGVERGRQVAATGQGEDGQAHLVQQDAAGQVQVDDEELGAPGGERAARGGHAGRGAGQVGGVVERPRDQRGQRRPLEGEQDAASPVGGIASTRTAGTPRGYAHTSRLCDTRPAARSALRLRVETPSTYKMVKHLLSIELMAEYRTSGDGQGGSREDTMFCGCGAEI